MLNKAPKFIIIGLDGADYHLVKDWLSKRELPTLKKFTEQGIHAILETTIPCNTAPALPSFYTGKNPAKTGVFGFTKSDGTLVTISDIDGPTLWDIMSARGYRLCLMGLRVLYPPPKMNGVVISGLYEPTVESDFVYPKERKQEFKDFYGGDAERQVLYKEWMEDPASNRQRIYSFLLKRTEAQFNTFVKTLRSENCDLGWLWVGDTDVLQHCFWGEEQLILDFYKEIDRMLKPLTEEFPDSNIILISDHGFAPVPKHDFYANSWLEQHGYLVIKGGPLKIFTKIAYDLATRHRFILRVVEKLKRLRGSKPSDTKGSLDLVMEDSVYDANDLIGVNWSKTLAYLGLDHQWGIKVIKDNMNAKDYEKVREEIIERLRALATPDGKKVMKGVWKREEIFPGKHLNEVPDIVFLIDDDYHSVQALSTRSFSKVTHPFKIKGWHTSARDALFIAFGPDIRQTGDIGTIKLYDMMPTILHFFGTPAPNDIDGVVLRQVFKENSEPSIREAQYVDYAAGDMRSVAEKVSRLKEKLKHKI